MGTGFVEQRGRAWGLAAAVVLSFGACRTFSDRDTPPEGSAGNGHGGENVGGTGGELPAGGTAGIHLDNGDLGGAAGEGGLAEGRASGEAGAAGAAAGDLSVQVGEIPGLAIWIAGSDCLHEGGFIYRCVDQSGAGNDAFPPTSNTGPRLSRGLMGSHDVISFGEDPEREGEPPRLLVNDDPSLHFGTGDFTVVLAARWRNDPLTLDFAAYGALLSKTEWNRPYKGLALFANYPTPYQEPPAYQRFVAQLDLGDQVLMSKSNYLNDDRYRVYVVRRVGIDLELRINGMGSGTLTTRPDYDISAEGSPITIGGGYGQELRGDLLEIVVINGPMSDSLLEGVERSLMVKYDLM